jgi:hypothetical protein
MQNDHGPNEIVPDPPRKPDADVALLRRAATRLVKDSDLAGFGRRRRRGITAAKLLKKRPLFKEAIERACTRLRDEDRDDQAQKLMVLWENSCVTELVQALRGIATFLDTADPPLPAAERETRSRRVGIVEPPSVAQPAGPSPTSMTPPPDTLRSGTRALRPREPSPRTLPGRLLATLRAAGQGDFVPAARLPGGNPRAAVFALRQRGFSVETPGQARARGEEVDDDATGYRLGPGCR